MADAPKDLDGALQRRPALRPFSGQLPTGGQGALRPLGARRPASAPFSPTGSASSSAPQRALTPPAVATLVAEEPTAATPPAAHILVAAEARFDTPTPAEAQSAVREGDPPPVAPAVAPADAPSDATDARFTAPSAITAPTPEALLAAPIDEAPAMTIAEPSEAASPAEPPAEPLADDVDASPAISENRFAAAPDYGDDLWPHDLAEEVDGLARASAERADHDASPPSPAQTVYSIAPLPPFDGSVEDEIAARAFDDVTDENTAIEVTGASTPATSEDRPFAPLEAVADVRLQSLTDPVEQPPPASAAQMLDDALSEFRLSPDERPDEPDPIPGLDAIAATFEGDNAPGEVSTLEAPSSEHEAAAGAGDAESGAALGEAAEPDGPSGATPRGDLLADSDASLRAFTDRAAAQAHVIDTLEAVARRVRSGEIDPVTSASATPEAVLASVLASLLGRRT